MNFAAKTRNAALAVLELAMRHEPPRPVNLKVIAQPHGLSTQFLVQILQQLKRAGIVESVRGAGGGYRLAMEPHQIRLLDVVEAMEGPLTSDPPRDSSSSSARVLADVWRCITHAQQRDLSRITFDQLAQAAQVETAEMYYI